MISTVWWTLSRPNRLASRRRRLLSRTKVCPHSLRHYHRYNQPSVVRYTSDMSIISAGIPRTRPRVTTGACHAPKVGYGRNERGAIKASLIDADVDLVSLGFSSCVSTTHPQLRGEVIVMDAATLHGDAPLCMQCKARVETLSRRFITKSPLSFLLLSFSSLSIRSA